MRQYRLDLGRLCVLFVVRRALLGFVHDLPTKLSGVGWAVIRWALKCKISPPEISVGSMKLDGTAFKGHSSGLSGRVL